MIKNKGWERGRGRDQYCFPLPRPPIERLHQPGLLHLQHPTGHDVVEGRHALEQGDVLEGPGDALLGRLMRAHLLAGDALIGDFAFLWVVEAVDNIKHRRLACPVRANDGADFMGLDIKADIGQRLHTTK